MSRRGDSFVLRLLGTSLLAGVSLPAWVEAQASSCGPPDGLNFPDTGVFLLSGTNVPSEWFDAAILAWETGCSSHSIFPGHDFPSFVTSGAGYTVEVSYVAGRSTASTGGCGEMIAFTPQNSNNVLGMEITLWSEKADGSACGLEPWQILAHEMGHVLGILNGNGCSGTIMQPGGGFGQPGTPFPLEVCTTADSQYNMGPSDDANLACLGNPFDPSCNPGGTPIVLDLGRRGITLTGYEEGVLFDLDADGAAERLGWTQAGSGDAFLAMDRNESGGIEDGSELFGDSTVLRNGRRAVHGFEALAELDDAEDGGDGDGAITPSDSGYANLLLWSDRNHNGVTDAGEVAGLEAHGVLRIGLRFFESRRRDRYGNQFRYNSWAAVVAGNGRRYVLASDVILVREPEGP